MKMNGYKKRMILLSVCSVAAMYARAQTLSDFEAFTLAPNSHNDGSSGSGAFTSGNAVFHNTYNSSWMFWDSGFAYSNEGDSTVSPSDYATQLFQSKAGMGASGSVIFGVGQQNARISFSGTGNGAYGMMVTNTTYAYNSMALGDSFGKKFGDTSAAVHSAVGVNQGYPDWFRLSVIGYSGGMLMPDTVDFYLADFRFANDSMDYIVKNWQFVDLSPFIIADSLEFLLTSSDNGSFGMNTPGFFCIDNFLSHDFVTGIASAEALPDMNAFPNPFEDNLMLDFKTAAARELCVYNASGMLVRRISTSEERMVLDLASESAGIYMVKVTEGNKSSSLRITKK